MTQQLMYLIGSLEQLNQQSPMFPEDDLQKLKKGIQGLNQGIIDEKTAITQLYGYTSELNSGLGEIHQGTQRLARETPALSSGMKELAKGQGQLADGLFKAEDGISTMKKESGGQFNELMRGQAVTDELENLADDYKSFMDNTKNSNSQVQFLMRTEGIEITEPAAEPAPEPTKNTPWQLIKNFFKNLFS